MGLLTRAKACLFACCAIVSTALPASAAHLDLMDKGWSAPAQLTAEKAIKWDYAFTDAKRVEQFCIQHDLPSDMTRYGGFTARVYLDSPSDTAFKIRFREQDGDTWEWSWGPSRAKQGWNDIEVANFLTGGSGPWPWDPGDRKRDYTSMDRVQVYLTDEPHRAKVGAGTLELRDFQFITVDEAQAIAARQAAEKAKLLNAMVDLPSICAMEDTGYWCGPRSEDIGISPECVQGKGSLQLGVNVRPNEHFRLERNFVRGDEFIEKDMSAVRSISFAVKGDVKGVSEGRFRLWDRAGGWLEWPVDLSASAKWRRVTVSVPGDTGKLIDLKRVGGFMWEVRAGGSVCSGKLLIDDLSFSNDAAHGAPAINRPVSPIDSSAISAPVVAKPIPAPPIHVIVNLSRVSYALQDGKADLAIERIREAMGRFGGIVNIEFAFGPEVTDAYKRLGVEKFTATLTTVARWCEANGVRFYIQVGGPSGIATPFESTKAVIDAAPKFCQGIWMGETPIEEYRSGTDDVVAMLDLLRERHKHLGYHRFTDAWWKFSLNRQNLDRVFAPRYADTIVPLWENLEPSCEGLTLGSALGFWLSGRAKQWGVSTQSFWWENMKLGGTPDMPAHNWMRMFVAAVGLGATYVQIEPEWAMKGECMKALQRFSDLVKAGAIAASPSPADTVGIPAVALQMKPTERTDSHSLWHVSPWNYIDRSRQVPSGDIFRSLYGSAHVYEQLMPVDSCGPVAILPQGRVENDLNLIQTDGSCVFDGDQWLSEPDSLARIESAYREGRNKMPLSAANCFFSAARLGDGDYIAYLIDPEERFPVDMKTNLVVRVPQPWTAHDGITGEKIAARGSVAPVSIPAGGFRLVRIVQE